MAPAFGRGLARKELIVIAHIAGFQINIYSDAQALRTNGKPIESMACDAGTGGTRGAALQLMAHGYLPCSGLNFTPCAVPNTWTIEVAKAE